MRKWSVLGWLALAALVCFSCNLGGPVNTAPTALSLSAAAIAENNAVGDVVGTLSATDADEGDTFSYALSGTDAASFSIDGDSLKAGAVFDYETKTSYSITLTVADAAVETFSEDFTITITNVVEAGENEPLNSAPTDITLTATALDENNAVAAVVGTLSTTDPDAGDTFAYTLSGTDSASFGITGNSLTAAEAFDYETQSSYSISITTTDSGSEIFTKDITITVNDLVDDYLAYWDMEDTEEAGGIYTISDPGSVGTFSAVGGAVGGYVTLDNSAAVNYLRGGTTGTGPSAPTADTSDDFNLGGSDAFTISLWIKIAAAPSSYPAILAYDDGSDSGYRLVLRSDGRPRFRTFNGTGYDDLNAASGSAVSDDAWHHLVFLYNDGAKTIYIDGVSDATGSGTITNNDDADGDIFCIGGLSTSGVSNNIDGAGLDELYFFPYEISAANIADLYAAGNE